MRAVVTQKSDGHKMTHAAGASSERTFCGLILETLEILETLDVERLAARDRGCQRVIDREPQKRSESANRPARRLSRSRERRSARHLEDPPRMSRLLGPLWDPRLPDWTSRRATVELPWRPRNRAVLTVFDRREMLRSRAALVGAFETVNGELFR